MWDYDRHWLFGVLGCVEAEVGDEVAAFVDGFEAFEGDVLVLFIY